MIPDDIKNVFVHFLKQNGQRITNERFLILDSALSMDGHFDADELYLKMKRDYLRVSRATVYKTLDLMSDCGILMKHNFKGERARFETRFGRKNHYHIICLSCNRIIEFEEPKIEKLQAKICKEMNLSTLEHTLQIFAKCNEDSNCEHFKKCKLDSRSSKKTRNKILPKHV